MDLLGFMPAAAPQPQPVLLTGAPAGAGASGDPAAAFDGALAATLAIIERESTQPSPPAGPAGEWLLAQPVAGRALDLLPADPELAGDSIGADEEAIVPQFGITAAQLPDGGEPAPQAILLTAFAVPQDPAADSIAAGPENPIPGANVPTGTPGGEPGHAAAAAPPQGAVVPSLPSTGEGDLNTAAVAAARIEVPAETPSAAAGADVRASHAQQPFASSPPRARHTGPGSSGTSSGDQAAAPTPRGVPGESVVPVTGAPSVVGAPLDPQAPASSSAIQTANGPAGDPARPAVVSSQALPQRVDHDPMVRVALEGAQATASTPAAASVHSSGGQASLQIDARSIQLHVDERGVRPSPERGGATVQTELAKAPHASMTLDALSGQDTAGAGQEQAAHDQPRPSREFIRFAAALSQVAAPDEGARTSGAGAVAPIAAGPSPIASAGPVISAAPAMSMPAGAIPDAENIGRLVQAIRINARQGAWEATVRLKPEHLGDVTIALRVDRNAVTAVVNAEAASVRQWLESQEQSVRNGLSEHGLQLERFVVQRDGQRREPQPQDQDPRRRHTPRRATEAAERFEIVV